MEIRTGTEVYDSQGRKAGEVSRVVVDGRTQDVTHIVVSKGWLLPRDIVVPIDEVETTRDEQVQLRLDEDKLEQYPDFIETRYIVPDENDRVPGEYVPGSVLYSPVAPGFGMGWNMPFGYAPASIPAETEVNVPQGSETLSEGMDIWAGDDKVGTVAGVRVHPQTEHVTHLIISRGWLFPEERLVPATDIATVDERGVHLRATADEIHHLPPLDNT